MSNHSLKPSEPFEATGPGDGSAESSELFEDLEQLADLVKRIYILERRMQESSLTGQPSCYLPRDERRRRATSPEMPKPRSSVWSSIASFLAERRIGPIDYIARQFDRYVSLTTPLFPANLLGKVAWQRYTESKATKREELAIRLRCCASALTYLPPAAGIIWPERPQRDIAMEDCLSALYFDDNLSPLFVYSVAARLGQRRSIYTEDVAALMCEHELPASVAYVRFRLDYDAVWQGLLPEGFPARAERNYSDLLFSLF